MEGGRRQCKKRGRQNKGERMSLSSLFAFNGLCLECSLLCDIIFSWHRNLALALCGWNFSSGKNVLGDYLKQYGVFALFLLAQCCCFS